MPLAPTNWPDLPNRRLFLDCDDTLVEYFDHDGTVDPGPNPYGGQHMAADRWRWNGPLRDALEHPKGALRNPETLVVVWSGGGFDYASGWLRLLGWDRDPRFTALITVASKDPALIRPGDVVVDDDPRMKMWPAPAVMTWQDYVESSRFLDVLQRLLPR